MDILFVLTHLLVGSYFVFFGIWNFYHWIPLFRALVDKQVEHPYLVLPLSLAWPIIGGLMIICGICVRFTACMLIPFLIVSLCLYHPFWKLKGEFRTISLMLFVSHLTLGLGSLFMLLAPTVLQCEFN